MEKINKKMPQIWKKKHPKRENISSNILQTVKIGSNINEGPKSDLACIKI